MSKIQVEKERKSTSRGLADTVAGVEENVDTVEKE
jgi:hypothetical protein